MNDQPIQDMLCEHRGIGMLFQRPVLFPFKDVLGNILFAYQSKKFWNMDDVHEVMNEMGLLGKEQQSIETLSGGEAQRVVLARTLLTNPKLLLLDEPLSALDVELRRKIAHEIRAVLKSRTIPAIHVTHDPAELRLLGIESSIGRNCNEVAMMRSKLLDPHPWKMWSYAWNHREKGIFSLVHWRILSSRHRNSIWNNQQSC